MTLERLGKTVNAADRQADALERIAAALELITSRMTKESEKPKKAK